MSICVHSVKPCECDKANPSTCPPPGVVACSVGDAPPYLWTCPNCSRVWHRHDRSSTTGFCGMCSLNLGLIP